MVHHSIKQTVIYHETTNRYLHLTTGSYLPLNKVYRVVMYSVTCGGSKNKEGRTIFADKFFFHLRLYVLVLESITKLMYSRRQQQQEEKQKSASFSE